MNYDRLHFYGKSVDQGACESSACRSGSAVLSLFFQVSSSRAAPNGIWTDGTGLWSLKTNWSNSNVPGGGDTVSIAPSDGVARTSTNDASSVLLAGVTVDLTGAGTAATLLSMSTTNLTTSAETIGLSGRGSLSQSGGVNTIYGGGNSFFVGYNASAVGLYTMTGGTLAVTGYEILGYLGTGTITQSAGIHTVAANYYFSLGSGGGTGFYNLSGTGQLTCSSSEYVGSNGAGTFTQTGGTNTINVGNNLIIANPSAEDHRHLYRQRRHAHMQFQRLRRRQRHRRRRRGNIHNPGRCCHRRRHAEILEHHQYLGHSQFRFSHRRLIGQRR